MIYRICESHSVLIVLNNSTTQALVLSRLANLIYLSYSRALGESPAAMSKMAGITMPGKEGSMNNMGINIDMKPADNAGMRSNMTMSMANGNTIINTNEISLFQKSMFLSSQPYEQTILL